MKLEVDDVVVYRSHGIGRVTARSKQVVLGEEQDVVVLELAGLTVTLPVPFAQTQLRQLMNAEELRFVGDALRADCELSSRNWLSRRRETLEKLLGGTPVELAEIVNEAARREHQRSASGKGPVPPSERATFTKARSLLSDELALALDIEPLAAERWIDSRLPHPA